MDLPLSFGVGPVHAHVARRAIAAAALALASGLAAGCGGSSHLVSSTAGHTASSRPSASLSVTSAAVPRYSVSPSPTHRVVHHDRTTCGTSLWKHVYHAYRLHVLSSCKAVRGTVEEVRWEPDGDLHILLLTSPGLVNYANRAYEHGDLVLEEICKGTVTQADAVAACRRFSQSVTVPSAGDKVTVSGSYVLDTDHGWREIHPVSRLTVTGHAAPAPVATTQAPPPSSAPAGCYPKTSSGNCYEPGEFCSTAEHGETGVAGDGKTINCENTDPGSTWHWVDV